MSHSMDSKRDKPRALDRKRWCPKAVPLVSDVFRFLWVASIFSFSLVALYTVFFCKCSCTVRLFFVIPLEHMPTCSSHQLSTSSETPVSHARKLDVLKKLGTLPACSHDLSILYNVAGINSRGRCHRPR